PATFRPRSVSSARVCARIAADASSAKDFLIEKGFNPDFGARPLRRAISTHVEDPLAELLLSGEFKPFQKILVTRKEEAENLFFTSEPLPRDEQEGEGGEGGEGGNGGEEPTPADPTQKAAPA
ncbi:MAG: hypothetical protein SYC29_12980, partial [Planctomycetota bacterium]|nr:hypothetical protein [Planctomycetota bacterium]